MKREILRKLVEQKSGRPPANVDDIALVPIKDLIKHADVDEYLRYCLPQFSYQASGIGVYCLRDIVGEMHVEAAPGGFIRPFGYLIVAKSAGGNVLCFGATSGKVFWTDHESFIDGCISFENRSTGDWEEFHEYTPQNVERAMVWLSDSIEGFLLPLLNDQLKARLDALG